MTRPRALITGGGKRIGAELVRRCAGLGFDVYIHVWQSQAEAEALRKTLPESSLHCISSCDLSDPAARHRWLEQLPGFDLVVNNASVYRLTGTDGVESAAVRERYWQVNCLAPLEIIDHQLRNLSAASSIVPAAITLLDCDVLTPAGAVKPYVEPAAGADSYLASRIFLAHKLLALAGELAPRLRICAIAPGPVLPPVNCTTGGMTRILNHVPMHRAVGVEEIANAMEFLWQNHSLTGHILPVDGGMHLWEHAGK